MIEISSRDTMATGSAALALQNVQGLNNQAGLQNQYSPYLNQALGNAYNQRLLAQMLGTNVYADYHPEDTEAEAKGLKLLKENFTPAQIESHDTHKYFDVKGSHSGKTYRIKRGRQMNVYELDVSGKEIQGHCFVPAESGLCVSDTILCQKIALETDEKAALKVANKFGVAGAVLAGGVIPLDNPLRQGSRGGVFGSLFGA